MLGNTPLSKAKVVYLGETHSDETYRRTVNELIERNYKKGDIILIEGVKAGKKVPIREGMVGYLNKNIDYDIRGSGYSRICQKLPFQ